MEKSRDCRNSLRNQRGSSWWVGKTKSHSVCVKWGLRIAIQRRKLEWRQRGGSFGNKEEFIGNCLKLRNRVMGAIYIFLVYVVWLLVLLCYKTLKDVKVWDFLVIVDAKLDKKNVGSVVYFFSFWGWRCFHGWVRRKIWIRGKLHEHKLKNK